MSLTQQQVSNRLDCLPVSRFHIKVLVIAALSLLFDSLDTAVTAFVLASLRSIWGFDARTLGSIAAIGLLGYFVGTFCCGFVADRIGRKKAILLTLILYSLFSAARGFCGSVSTLALLNFFTFIFIGGESAAVPPYLAELWPARIRGKLTGWMMSFFGFGVALTPLWALAIIPNLGWRWAFWLTAPFALIGGTIRSKLPESPRWLLKKGKIAEAEAAVALIEAKVGETALETWRPALRPAPTVETARHAPAALSLVRPRDLLGGSYLKITLMLWVAWFAEYGVKYSFDIFVPTILASEGFPIVNSFQYAVIIYAGVIPAHILGGHLVEWFDRKYTLLISFAATILFGTLFGFSTRPAEIMLFGNMTAFFVALGGTAIYAYTPELYPTEIRATGMGIASSWGRIGAITMLLVFGTYLEALGKFRLFMISDSVLLVASVVVLLLGPSTRGRELEETSRGSRRRESPGALSIQRGAP